MHWLFEEIIYLNISYALKSSYSNLLIQMFVKNRKLFYFTRLMENLTIKVYPLQYIIIFALKLIFNY